MNTMTKEQADELIRLQKEANELKRYEQQCRELKSTNNKAMAYGGFFGLLLGLLLRS